MMDKKTQKSRYKDSTADQKILARMSNRSGAAGRDERAMFTEAKFTLSPIPEPASVALLGPGLALVGFMQRRNRPATNRPIEV